MVSEINLSYQTNMREWREDIEYRDFDKAIMEWKDDLEYLENKWMNKSI